MEKITIHRVRLLKRGLDRDFVLGAVSDHLGATGEELAVGFHLPRRNDLKVRREGHVGELEAALIVAFARGAVGDGIGFFLLGYVHLGLGDERAGDGGSEVILALVNRVGADHRVDVVRGEFLDQIEGVVLGGAGGLGLLIEALQLFFLADVGCEGDDLRIISLFEPFDDHGGVETTGVSEDDFHRGKRI